MSERFAALVGALDTAERSELAAALAAAATAARLAKRNAAIRAALADYDGPRSRRAKALALELSRYVAAGWRHEAQFVELPKTASDRRRLLHKITRTNGGRGLRWRQIFTVSEVCNFPR